jgi:hypothetical protein
VGTGASHRIKDGKLKDLNHLPQRRNNAEKNFRKQVASKVKNRLEVTWETVTQL